MGETIRTEELKCVGSMKNIEEIQAESTLQVGYSLYVSDVGITSPN